MRFAEQKLFAFCSLILAYIMFIKLMVRLERERGKEYMREMGVTKKAKVGKQDPKAKLHTLHCFG